MNGDVDLERRLQRLEGMLAALILSESGVEALEEMWPALVRRMRSREEPPFWPWEEIFLTMRAERKRIAEQVASVEQRISEMQDWHRHVSSESENLRNGLRSVESEMAYVSAERLPDLATKVESATTANAELRSALHPYLFGLSFGLSLDEMRVPRFLPVRVYLGEGSDPSIDAATEGVDRLLRDLGFDEAEEFPPEFGSWFGKWFVRSKEALGRDEVQERLKKVERAVDLAYVHGKQARADRDQLEGVAALIASLEGQERAVVQVGSLLLIKTMNEAGESTIVTRTLTQSEVIEVERNPDLLKHPQQILERLGSVTLPLSDGNRDTDR